MRKLIVAAVMAVLSAAPALANVTCWGELSAGKNITAAGFDAGMGSVNVSDSSVIGGIGAGCDVALKISETVGFGTPIIGFLARYDWADISSAAVSTDGMWSAAVRAGVYINPSVLAYVQAGVAGASLAYQGLSDDQVGLLLGAGLELDVAIKNLSIIFEYQHIEWDEYKIGGVDLKPDSDMLRVGARLKLDFNSMLQGK